MRIEGIAERADGLLQLPDYPLVEGRRHPAGERRHLGPHAAPEADLGRRAGNLAGRAVHAGGVDAAYIYKNGCLPRNDVDGARQAGEVRAVATVPGGASRLAAASTASTSSAAAQSASRRSSIGVAPE